MLSRIEAGIKKSHASKPVRNTIDCLARLCGYTLSAPEQEEFRRSLNASLGLERFEYIGSGDTFSQRNTDQSADPNQRHTVRGTEVTKNQSLTETRIRLAIYQEIEIWRREQKWPFIGNCSFYTLH